MHPFKCLLKDNHIIDAGIFLYSLYIKISITWCYPIKIGTYEDALCKNFFTNTQIAESDSLIILLFDKKFSDKLERIIKLETNLEKCDLMIF